MNKYNRYHKRYLSLHDINNYNTKPEIFRLFGLRFFFYSDEHLPIHIHVKNGDGEAKFEIATDHIILKQSFGMKSKDLKMAEDLILQHQD